MRELDLALRSRSGWQPRFSGLDIAAPRDDKIAFEMKIQEAAAGYIDRAHVSVRDAERLCSELGIGREELLRSLVSVAANHARAPISNFQVGAVAEGTSGALYLGANIEIVRGNLSLTIHAEQAAILNASAHGETGVRRMAITAEPCGYCRQFLKELVTAEELVILTGTRSLTLNDLLPNAFGPADLGVQAGQLSPQDHAMELPSSNGEISKARRAALEAANRSYAPYTRAYGGAAITTKSGEIFASSYFENAAYNPSLQPAQGALALAVLAGAEMEDIASIEVVQRAGSPVDHIAYARLVAAAIDGKIQVAGTVIDGSIS